MYNLENFDVLDVDANSFTQSDSDSLAYGDAVELPQVFSTFSPQLCNMTNATDMCNVTSSDYYDYEDSLILEKVISIIVPILFGIIVVVGLFGNALVVIVIACNPQMRNTTNLLIINLAIADLLFIVLCVPFTAWDYAFPYWPFGDIWCRCVQYLILVSFTAVLP